MPNFQLQEIHDYCHYFMYIAEFCLPSHVKSFLKNHFNNNRNYLFDWGDRIGFKINGMYSIKYSPHTFLDKTFAFIWLDIVCLALPISLNALFFAKVRKFVQSSSHFSEKGKAESLAIWRYPLATIVCFIPGVLLDVIVGLSGSFYPFWLSIACNLLHRAWAFLNIWVYWGLTVKANNNQEDLLDEENVHSNFSLSSSRSLTSTFISKEGSDHHVTFNSRPSLK